MKVCIPLYAAFSTHQVSLEFTGNDSTPCSRNKSERQLNSSITQDPTGIICWSSSIVSSASKVIISIC